VNDPVEAALPEFQHIARTLEELAEGAWVQLVGKVEEQLAGVVAAEHALSLLNEHAVELLHAIDQLKTERESATHELQTQVHDLAGASASWQSNVSEAGASVQHAVDGLNGTLAEVARQGTDHIDQFRGLVGERLHASYMDGIKTGETAVTRGVHDAHAEVEQLGAELASKAQAELQHLEQQLKDAFASKLENDARRRMEDQAARLGSEVADNLLLSEASAAITGAVTPILPELIALKGAVGIIKFALHPFG
jgi:F0F1-type ATP synthase membrane subunit b/b'